MSNKGDKSWINIETTGSNYYSWSMSENTGRNSRSASIKVATSEQSSISASTAFTQSGTSAFLSVISTNPLNVGASAGYFTVSCETNLSEVEIFISDSSAERGLMNILLDHASGQSGITTEGKGLIPEYPISSHYLLTFVGDPGATYSFRFFITCSYSANTSATKLAGKVLLGSGSTILATQNIVQSSAVIGEE